MGLRGLALLFFVVSVLGIAWLIQGWTFNIWQYYVIGVVLIVCFGFFAWLSYKTKEDY